MSTYAPSASVTWSCRIHTSLSLRDSATAILAENTDIGAGLPRLSLVSLWPPCAYYVTSLDLSFIIYKMGIIEHLSTHRFTMELEWVNPCKLLKLVSGTQLSSPKVLTNIISFIIITTTDPHACCNTPCALGPENQPLPAHCPLSQASIP